MAVAVRQSTISRVSRSVLLVPAPRGEMLLVAGSMPLKAAWVLVTRSSQITPWQAVAEAKVEMATRPGRAAAAESLREAACSLPPPA